MAAHPSVGRLSELFIGICDSSGSLQSHREQRYKNSSSDEISELVNENLEFYGKIQELEQAVEREQEEKRKLDNKLQKQEATIKKLVDMTLQTKRDELDMTSEIWILKRELARERKLNARIHRDIDRQNIENELGVPSFAEVREKELIQKVKDAHESVEQSHRDAQMAALEMLSAEEQKVQLVAELEKLRSEIKSLRVVAGESEEMRGIIEGLEIQVKEERATIEDLLGQLEQLRKENFELLRRPSPVVLETEVDHAHLEKALQLQLRRRIDRLEREKDELTAKLEEASKVCIEEERALMQSQLETAVEEREEALHRLVLQKCETEKLAVSNQTLAKNLDVAKETLALETLNWTRRIEELETRAESAEEQRNVAEGLVKSHGSAKNTIIDELYRSRALIEPLELENQQLHVQIQTLNDKVADERERGLRLRDELEGKLKPEIAELRQQLNLAESSNERLKGDVELKEYLLGEEKTVAQQTKTQLDRAQKSLEESETRLTQQSRLTSDQAERLANNDSLIKKRDSELKALNKKVSALECSVQDLKAQLHTAMEANQLISQSYESLEGRYTLIVDEHRAALSDVAFYRQELERYSVCLNSAGTGLSEAEREDRLKSVLDGLKRQIAAAKEEIKSLDRDVNERIKNLPLDVSESEEFEIVHIVQHFQGEKNKVVDELRATMLRLSEAEGSYQSLIDVHQKLQKSHSRALKDLLDLKSCVSLKNSPPMIDVCVGTSGDEGNRRESSFLGRGSLTAIQILAEGPVVSRLPLIPATRRSDVNNEFVLPRLELPFVPGRTSFREDETKPAWPSRFGPATTRESTGQCTVKQRIAQFDKRRGADDESATASPCLRYNRSDSPRVTSVARASHTSSNTSSNASSNTSSNTNTGSNTSSNTTRSAGPNNEIRREHVADNSKLVLKSSTKQDNDVPLAKRKIAHPAAQARSSSRNGRKVFLKTHLFE